MIHLLQSFPYKKRKTAVFRKQDAFFVAEHFITILNLVKTQNISAIFFQAADQGTPYKKSLDKLFFI